MTGERFKNRIAATVFHQLEMNPIPQLMKPLIELYANRNMFTGRPIESFGMEQMEPEDRYTARTSETAKLLGRLGLPNPSRLAAGEWETLSPVQIEHLVRGYFSWIGMQVLAGLDFGLRPLLDRGEKPAMALRDVFLVGNFVESLPARGSRYVTEFYDQAKEVEEAYQSFRNARKYRRPERAQEIAEDGTYRQIKTVTRGREALRRINERIKLTTANAKLSAQAKREELDRLQVKKNEVAKRLAGLLNTE